MVLLLFNSISPSMFHFKVIAFILKLDYQHCIICISDFVDLHATNSNLFFVQQTTTFFEGLFSIKVENGR